MNQLAPLPSPSLALPALIASADERARLRFLEFFAVTSEYFFSAPDVLHEAFPDVYAQLAAFYRQDPLVRLEQLQHSHPQYAEPH